MLAEHGNISVGIDLGRDYSQIAFCSKSDRAPLMVMQSEEEKEENDYLIRTPVDLFSLVERKDARGVEVLYQFLKECFALLKGAGSVEHMTVMVTMHEMKGIWADVIRTALLKLGIPSSAIFLQGHLESFYTYLMNQKKELLTYHVALLEYERDCITAWHFWLERKTKPVLAKTEKCFRLYLDNKARKGRGDEEWGILRDSLLHKNLEKMFENTPFSAVYLVGREFEGEWMDKSFRFLCRKRRSFRGDNLYTMGACYAAMEENGATACKDTLYLSDDMIQHNLGMWMEIRGQEGYYPLVNAGINWYMARHTCEFLLGDEKEVVIYSRTLAHRRPACSSCSLMVALLYGSSMKRLSTHSPCAGRSSETAKAFTRAARVFNPCSSYSMTSTGFMKVCTPRPAAKRAVPEVGSTWLEPDM